MPSPAQLIHLSLMTNLNNKISYKVQIENLWYPLVFPTDNEDPQNNGAYFVDSGGIKQRIFIVDGNGKGAFLYQQKEDNRLAFYNFQLWYEALNLCVATAEVFEGNIITSDELHRVLCLPASDERVLYSNYGTTTSKLFSVDIDNQRLQRDEYLANRRQRLKLAREGKTRTTSDSSNTSISMMILGGFISVVGITAVALAFAVSNAATLGVPSLLLAIVGVSTIIAGIGLFSSQALKNTYANQEQLKLDLGINTTA